MHPCAQHSVAEMYQPRCILAFVWRHQGNYCLSPREILRRTVLVFYFRWGFLQDVEMYPFMSPKIKVTLVNKADIISKTWVAKQTVSLKVYNNSTSQVRETDRERDGERERESKTERERKRETDRERKRETDRERGLLGIVPYDFHTTDAVFILYITHTLK